VRPVPQADVVRISRPRLVEDDDDRIAEGHHRMEQVGRVVLVDLLAVRDQQPG
jgi:hypothetical protein